MTSFDKDMSVSYLTALSGRQVRVLMLEPGSEDDLIVISLEVMDLDAGSTLYDALSYCWDDQKPSRLVSCNDKQCLITQNVEEAMIALRSPSRPVHLWIDQLCINQANVAERNQQVAMMADIYRKACKVVIWLGREDRDTATLFTILNMFASARERGLSLVQTSSTEDHQQQQLHMRQSTFSTNMFRESPADTQDTSLALSSVSQSAEWESFLSGISRSWFGRMWTFQEAVLGSQLTEFRCGRFLIGVDAFYTAATELMLRGHRKVIKFNHPAYAALWMLEVIGSTRLSLRGTLAGQRLQLLLSSTKRLRCKDPHDKVYALLGTCKPDYLTHLKVDYNQPLTTLYGDVVKACISVDKDLSMLALVEHWDKDIASWPSWLPHLNDTRSGFGFQFGLRRPGGQRCYTSCGKLEAALSLSTQTSHLNLRGARFRKISRIWRFSISAAQYTNINDWNSRFSSAAQHLKIPKCSHLDATRASVLTNDYLARPDWHDNNDVDAAILRRVVTADVYPRRDRQRLSEEELWGYVPLFCAWRNSTVLGGGRSTPPLDVLLEHNRFEREILRSRWICVAGDESINDAYLCVSAIDTQVGDWVCVLAGGDAPIVLREKETTSVLDVGPVSAGTRPWQFICECYVEGIMDGEALERKTERDLETFTLV